MKDDMKRTSRASRARRAQQRKRRNRRIALTLCVMFVVLAASIGGTVAWLTDKTGTIENTFTAGDINIELTETDREYKMVPGVTLPKDPEVTVKAGSEDCWLFVKVGKAANFDDFMTYAIAEGWMALAGVDGVYYREAKAGESFGVLANNQVTVKEDVTKAQLDAVRTTNKPTLTFTAYAVQKTGINNAATAWTKVAPTTTP